MTLKKCVFLDRDGVLNVDRNTYTFNLEDFELQSKVPEAIENLKKQGYLLIVITNQAGIAKGLYTKNEVLACHQALQNACDNQLNGLYYSPYHPDYTESLSRKPGSLMLEKAISKFSIDVSSSFMVGDKVRDLIPAKKLGLKTVLVDAEHKPKEADFLYNNLFDFSVALPHILK